jgi:hypothetical protein
MNRTFSILLLIPILAISFEVTQAQLTTTQQSDRIDVFRDGKLVTSYLFNSGTKPVLWPIHGPDGHKMTRSYPMDATVPNEAHDHPHHRGLWMTFGEVNKTDWWAEGKDRGTVLHQKVVSCDSQGASVSWIAEHQWLTPAKSNTAGQAVLNETSRYRVSANEDQTIIDCETIWRSADPNMKVHFGDTKEGMFAIRVPETMRGDKPGGQILNSHGDKQGDTWGKPAKWVDYSGPVPGGAEKLYGIAILVHPKSFHADGLWHVRTYGLFAHNAFGIKDFLSNRTKTKSAELDLPYPAGGYELSPEDSLHFMYRVVFHRDRWDLKTGDQQWSEFSQQPMMLK